MQFYYFQTKSVTHDAKIKHYLFNGVNKDSFYKD